MFYPKYKLLLEDELKEIPELVNYKREITGQLRNYGSITDEIVRSILSEQEREDNLTRTTDMTNTNTGSVNTQSSEHDTSNSRTDNQLNQNVTESTDTYTSDSSSGQTNGSTSSNGHDRARGMMRQLPQSIEYGGAGQIGFDATGYPNKFEWSTATHQAEDVTDSNNLGTSTSDSSSSSNGSSESSMHNVLTNTGYSTTSGTSDANGTVNQTQNTQSRDSGNVRDTGSQNVTGSSEENSSNVRRLDDKHDSYSTQKGFYGMTEAEIRQNIWSFISNSIALQWFIQKMDRCFIGVFD